MAELSPVARALCFLRRHAGHTVLSADFVAVALREPASAEGARLQSLLYEYLVGLRLLTEGHAAQAAGARALAADVARAWLAAGGALLPLLRALPSADARPVAAGYLERAAQLVCSLVFGLYALRRLLGGADGLALDGAELAALGELERATLLAAGSFSVRAQLGFEPRCEGARDERELCFALIHATASDALLRRLGGRNQPAAEGAAAGQEPEVRMRGIGATLEQVLRQRHRTQRLDVDADGAVPQKRSAEGSAEWREQCYAATHVVLAASDYTCRPLRSTAAAARVSAGAESLAPRPWALLRASELHAERQLLASRLPDAVRLADADLVAEIVYCLRVCADADSQEKETEEQKKRDPEQGQPIDEAVAVEEGTRYLLRTQRGDGSWTTPRSSWLGIHHNTIVGAWALYKRVQPPSTAAPAVAARPREAPSNTTSSEGQDVEHQPGPAASEGGFDGSVPLRSTSLQHGGAPLPMQGISLEALVQIAERLPSALHLDAEEADAISTSDVCRRFLQPAGLPTGWSTTMVLAHRMRHKHKDTLMAQSGLQTMMLRANQSTAKTRRRRDTVIQIPAATKQVIQNLDNAKQHAYTVRSIQRCCTQFC